MLRGGHTPPDRQFSVRRAKAIWRGLQARPTRMHSCVTRREFKTEKTTAMVNRNPVAKYKMAGTRRRNPCSCQARANETLPNKRHSKDCGNPQTRLSGQCQHQRRHSERDQVSGYRTDCAARLSDTAKGPAVAGRTQYISKFSVSRQALVFRKMNMQSGLPMTGYA